MDHLVAVEASVLAVSRILEEDRQLLRGGPLPGRGSDEWVGDSFFPQPTCVGKRCCAAVRFVYLAAGGVARRVMAWAWHVSKRSGGPGRES